MVILSTNLIELPNTCDSSTLVWIASVKRCHLRLSVTFRPLVKQTTTRNLYITIYIYFLDGRLCEVGAVRRGIRIVRWWGLNFSMSGDEGRDNAHCVMTREVSWTAGSFFLYLLLFNSSALYYRHTSTPPQFLPISGDRDVSLPLAGLILLLRGKTPLPHIQKNDFLGYGTKLIWWWGSNSGKFW